MNRISRAVVPLFCLAAFPTCSPAGPTSAESPSAADSPAADPSQAGLAASTAEPKASTPSKASDGPCLGDDEPGCAQKCEAGNLESCCRLASIYAFGNANVKEDLPKSRALHDKACQGGLGKGCYFLASDHELGRSIPKDAKKAAELVAKAVPLLTAACEGSDGESCSILADMHMVGNGVPKSEAKEASLRARATVAYGRQCEGGDASACFMFGGDMLGAKKEELAARILQKGCDAGDAASCSLLGGCYDEGAGVAVDKLKAKALWKKACKGGIAAACGR